MLRLALIFFVIAVIAGIFGFGNIATGAASIAQFLFVLFLILFIGALVLGLFVGRKVLG